MGVRENIKITKNVRQKHVRYSPPIEPTPCTRYAQEWQPGLITRWYLCVTYVYLLLQMWQHQHAFDPSGAVYNVP